MVSVSKVIPIESHGAAEAMYMKVLERLLEEEAIAVEDAAFCAQNAVLEIFGK